MNEKKAKIPLKPWVVFLRILGIMFVAEFCVMALLWAVDVDDGVREFFLDSLILSILSAPFIYYLVVKVVAKRLSEEHALAQSALESTVTIKAFAEKMALKAYSDNIVESVPSGLATLGPDLQVIRVNQALLRMFQASAAELVGRPVAEVLPVHGLIEAIEEVRSTGRPVRDVTLDSSRDKTDRYYQVSVNEVPPTEEGGVRQLLLVFEDITEKKLSEDKVVFMAHHDNLTGLPNRRLLKDRINQTLPRIRREKSMAAVMFLDLDRFKFINDTLGHAVGDELLKVVAGRLSACIRPSDTAARLGGDEFIVLLAGVEGVEDVTKVTKRIFSSFDEPVTMKGHEFSVTTSVGISMYPSDGSDAEALIKNADTAMYRAKSEGRNNSQFYSPSMNETGMEWMKLERKLRLALEREEFLLYYQPQVNACTGELIGMEALVRWQDPDSGLIPPGEFIKMAEETGLIVQLGTWVLRAACMQAREWHDAGKKPVKVSVNLSMRQFKRKDFVETVSSIVNETGVEAHSLELELTESIIMEEAEETIAKLKALKAMGIRLSIDDFGTGYSSLAYLRRMPIDELKIDQSFVRDINVDSSDAAICEAIVRMARSLEIDVIAEGVETTDQLEMLREIDCINIQGYLVSKPCPPRELEPFLDPSWRYKGG